MLRLSSIFQSEVFLLAPSERKVVWSDLCQSGDRLLLSQSLLKPDSVWQDQVLPAMKRDKRSFSVQCRPGTRLQSWGLDRESWNLLFPESPHLQLTLRFPHLETCSLSQSLQGENYKMILERNSVFFCHLSVNIS